MITDEKMAELVQRAQAVCVAGFARNMQFPEQVAFASPVMAVVLEQLIREESAMQHERDMMPSMNNYRLES